MPNREQDSMFSTNPVNLDLSRSVFNMAHSHKTTFNVGDIVPFEVMEILPGDTVSIDTSKIVRLQTPITPIMDNIYLDTYWFFVPNRIVWKHWKEFMGENTESAWLPQTTYQVPKIRCSSGFPNGSVADHMGVPLGQNCLINALPFRGYAKICSEWFRSEALSDPLLIPDGDGITDVIFSNPSNPFVGFNEINGPALGMNLYRAAKFFDYFTACLPAPQRGPDVRIPTSTENGFAKVGTAGLHDGALTDPKQALQWSFSNPSNSQTFGFNTSGSTTYIVEKPSTAGFDQTYKPVNLWADLGASLGTINDLRLAFQIQKLYEKDARGGTRYIEILKSHFGVTSPDSRLQRPEYLGGNRVPININQIVNTTEGSGDVTLGNVGAMSVTADSHSDFTHSFTEHGFLFGLMVARYDHTYQQNLERFWSRSDRLDYYWPVLANIGEQAVLNKEIWLGPNVLPGASSDVPTDPDGVFGYQSAWMDYRYRPNIVTGEMRSVVTAGHESLDVWHLGDDYQTQPHLSDAWIKEDKANVDRVLSVTSSVADQLFADIYIDCKATRCMPVNSIPGLVDHH